MGQTAFLRPVNDPRARLCKAQKLHDSQVEVVWPLLLRIKGSCMFGLKEVSGSPCSVDNTCRALLVCFLIYARRNGVLAGATFTWSHDRR